MIKINASSLKPIQRRLGYAQNIVKKATIAMVLPAALSTDIFTSDVVKNSESKKDYEYCSDFCMEISG